MASILVSMESRLLDCEGGVYALLFICVSEIHRLMAAEKGAAVDDKGLLQDAETIDEDGTTYIVIKEEYRQHVFGRSGVTMLPRLGPAELYEVWKNEVLPFLQRAAADPTVLCDRRGWRQCYTSTLTQQYGRLNEAMHGVGNKQGGGSMLQTRSSQPHSGSRQQRHGRNRHRAWLRTRRFCCWRRSGWRSMRKVCGGMHWDGLRRWKATRLNGFASSSCHRCCRALALTSRSSVTASGHTSTPSRARGCHRCTWVDEAQPHLRRQELPANQAKSFALADAPPGCKPPGCKSAAAD